MTSTTAAPSAQLNRDEAGTLLGQTMVAVLTEFLASYREGRA